MESGYGLRWSGSDFLKLGWISDGYLDEGDTAIR
jgi:hypothetical protein